MTLLFRVNKAQFGWPWCHRSLILALVNQERGRWVYSKFQASQGSIVVLFLKKVGGSSVWRFSSAFSLSAKFSIESPWGCLYCSQFLTVIGNHIRDWTNPENPAQRGGKRRESPDYIVYPLHQNVPELTFSLFQSSAKDFLSSLSSVSVLSCQGALIYDF